MIKLLRTIRSSKLYSVIMNKQKAGKVATAGSRDVETESTFSRIIAVILNKNPKKNKQSQRPVPVASEAQVSAIKAHLMPITLFVKINKLLFGLVLVSALFLIVTVFEHLSLYPLVETQYNYAEFVGSDHNFVNVIHTRHIENEHLIQSLLRRYVVEREQIIKKPSKLVEKFSSPEVYKAYFEVIKKIARKDLRSKIRRFIKILRYQKIESNIRQLEVEFTDMIKTRDGKSTRIAKSTWLINIKFEFIDTIRRYSEIAINPAGLIITVYNIKRQS